jgi:hypothetical protein
MKSLRRRSCLYPPNSLRLWTISKLKACHSDTWVHVHASLLTISSSGSLCWTLDSTDPRDPVSPPLVDPSLALSSAEETWSPLHFRCCPIRCRLEAWVPSIYQQDEPSQAFRGSCSSVGPLARREETAECSPVGAACRPRPYTSHLG